MAQYRRFVAYVYEYQKGKKANNSGFIKVEAKEGHCRMEVHLQCPGLAPEMECNIYSFFRRAGLMEGIHLGNCKTSANMVECTIESDTENMGDSGFGLKQMGGVVIQTERGVFFGTEWDDEIIHPENFREFHPEDKHSDAVLPAQEEKEQEDVGEETLAETKDDPLESQKELVEEKEEGQEEKEIPDGDGMMSGQAVPPFWDKKEKIKEKPVREEEDCIFEDDEIEKCWKIQPQDLAYFDKKDWGLRNNRFLVYGYYNFGHLLLCRKADGGYLLGIPGGYDQQERFMANMFGFPCFKESRNIRLRKGKGGYWYRSVNPPNFHQWDRFQENRPEMV